MKLAAYADLVRGFNAKVPTEFQLPAKPIGDVVAVGDDSAQMKVMLAGDEVTSITVVTDDTDRHTFMTLYVKGVEGGMGWTSASHYQAMMATLKDHGEHVSVEPVVTAAYSWADNQVTVVLTATDNTK
ncbi:hypothetical protein [Streptomyces arenae]|uniref:hypothetical protein n=1 Tax=Streptomyces arenae TaxID=29301 RepID=UPI002659E102|nr:hypothetical protein [Streptomyces arenae]MCG7210066.1 hypothetical protein [Streptomyces arenae]